MPGKEKDSSAETVALSYESRYDAASDKRLMRKVDLHPDFTVFAVFFGPFKHWSEIPALVSNFNLLKLIIQRIGNAKLDGLTTDLHVPGPGYNTALALYFVGYVLFEIPANIVLKRFNPRVWLPTVTLVWGIVSVCQGLVHNQAGLFAIRFLLGVSEAGLFPGTIFVFSVYYKRRERHWRVAVFFGGAAIAGAFGGAIAYCLGLMDGVGGKRGWAWIFIIEGLLTIVIAIGAYLITPTWPQEASFLTEAERTQILERLKEDSDASDKEPFSWVGVRDALTDHLVWAYAFLFHGFAFVLYSFSLFLPSIIAGLGFASWKAQLMTVPTYGVATGAIALAAWASARYKKRALFIIISAVVAIIGYALLIGTNTSGKQYLGCYFAASGIYAGNALLLSWPGENVSPQTKRAVAVAMQISIGDIGAIAGVLVYRPSLNAHRFRTPHAISIGYLVFGALVAGYLWYWMDKENKRRELIMQGSGDRGEKGGEILSGDRAPNWKFQI